MVFMASYSLDNTVLVLQLATNWIVSEMVVYVPS